MSTGGIRRVSADNPDAIVQSPQAERKCSNDKSQNWSSESIESMRGRIVQGVQAVQFSFGLLVELVRLVLLVENVSGIWSNASIELIESIRKKALESAT